MGVADGGPRLEDAHRVGEKLVQRLRVCDVRKDEQEQMAKNLPSALCVYSGLLPSRHKNMENGKWSMGNGLTSSSAAN